MELFINNNNTLNSEIDPQAFTSFGKVTTNKDGIIQIIWLEDVVVG
jgi:F-type H+-transporting ATPase subunit alpha